MKARSLLLSLFAIVLVFQMTACSIENDSMINLGTSDEAGQPVFPMTLVDSFGRKIVLDSEPGRIVSIAPGVTESIFALGKQDKLVGRTEFCDYPEEVSGIEQVGSLESPNIEKILELKPDLIIASTHFQKETLAKLEGVGMKVAVLYGEESFEGVYEIMQKLGAVLNAKEKADVIISDMEQKIEMVENKVKALERPSVYYVVGYGKYGDYTAGKDTFISRIIEMAGGKNAAYDVEGWKYSLEKLIEKNPDIIICSKYFDTKAGIKNTNGYNSLNAVKEGRLYEIDNNMLDRQGPRLVDGLLEMAKIIHPEAF